jgi:hypothetical protein
MDVLSAFTDIPPKVLDKIGKACMMVSDLKSVFIMSELGLYRVHASQEWRSEGSALVWARSIEDAIRATKDNIDLNPEDDCYSSMVMTISELPLTALDGLKPYDYTYIVPENMSHKTFTWADLDEFMTFVSEEDMEMLRIRNIEKDNGQLPLFNND